MCAAHPASAHLTRLTGLARVTRVTPGASSVPQALRATGGGRSSALVAARNASGAGRCGIARAGIAAGRARTRWLARIASIVRVTALAPKHERQGHDAGGQKSPASRLREPSTVSQGCGAAHGAMPAACPQ